MIIERAPLVTDWDRAALIFALDRVLVNTLADIMNHPRLVALKNAWADLEHLVQQLALTRQQHPQNVNEVNLLCISKEDLLQDFDNAMDAYTTGIWFHTYTREFDQAGGQPYTAMLVQYRFSHRAQDIALLGHLGRMGMGTHCPVITNAAPEFFDLERFQNLDEIRNFSALFAGSDYKRWHALRQQPESRYLALTLPGVTRPLKAPYYRPRFSTHPKLVPTQTSLILGSTLLGLAMNRSYALHGWAGQIRGSDTSTGGLVEGIDCQTVRLPGLVYHNSPAEVGFSDSRERALAEQGFIPLHFHKLTQKLCFFSSPCLQDPSGLEDEGEKRLAVSLPFVLLISHIAHYQKMIQRENLGRVSKAEDMQKELQAWLDGLVMDVHDPTPQQRAMRPLRKAQVAVNALPSSPGFFEVTLSILPHIQIEGITTMLTLVSRMELN